METDNSSHYKYMPHPVGEEATPHEEEMIKSEESAVFVQTEASEIPPVKSSSEENPDNEENPDKTEREGSHDGTTVEELKAFSSPLARFFYGLFGPLLVPTYVCILVFLLSILSVIVPGAVLPYSLTVFGASCIVPFITVYILLKVGEIKSFRLETARERVIPYIVEFLALGGITLFFLFKGANPWIWALYCGGASVALVNLLINFKMRISCHCSAMAALVASLIVISKYGMPQISLFWWIIGAVFFAGYVGTVAISYGKHSIWEVLAGYATGFLGVILFSLIH